jgi:hypothetical protein
MDVKYFYEILLMLFLFVLASEILKMVSDIVDRVKYNFLKETKNISI